MTTQNKNVPALRFPEFSEDWKTEKIEPYLKLYVERVKADTDIPVLTSSRNGLFFQKDYFDNRELDNEGEYGVVPKGYFTYRHMSDDSTFKFNINNLCEKGAVSKEYPVFTTQEMDSFFLQLKLNNGEEFKKFAVEQKRGGTRTRLYFNRLTQLNLSLPTLSEQQKIAAFFTVVDEKIQQLAKKKDLLEQYKKGVMQKIFNQEIRFKDDNGNDFADWEEKKFGQIFSFRTTNSFSRDNLNYENGEVKNIHYGDIHTKFSSLFDITRESVPFVNKDISLKKIAEDNYCKVGDLVIADASEDYADIGKCIEITNLNDEKVLAGLHTFLARPDLYKMAAGFSGYLMKSQETRLQIMTIAQGTKVLSISTVRLANIKLNIPSEPEQQKIANFLSAIDEKINLVNQQLEKTKEYKKGLLQQMFV